MDEPRVFRRLHSGSCILIRPITSVWFKDLVDPSFFYCSLFFSVSVSEIG
jgi:hypothetical protein